MNSGKWDYDRWGHPGEPGVGSGAELWAWMGEGDGAETRYHLVPILFSFSLFLSFGSTVSPRLLTHENES